MTKREHIAALEKRLEALEREVASIPRWSYTYQTTPYVYPPMKIGDGTAAGLPSTNSTIFWGSGFVGVTQ